MDIFLRKLPTGALVPDTEKDAELLKKFKTGDPLKCTIVRPRNYKFHKKFFSLINHSFDCWEPENEVGEKNKDQFREDLIILAGFYHRYIRLDGSTRIKAKSVSFANMDQDEFDELYDKVLQVILDKVLRNYTKEDLDMVVSEIMSYA